MMTNSRLADWLEAGLGVSVSECWSGTSNQNVAIKAGHALRNQDRRSGSGCSCLGGAGKGGAQGGAQGTKEAFCSFVFLSASPCLGHSLHVKFTRRQRLESAAEQPQKACPSIRMILALLCISDFLERANFHLILRDGARNQK